VKASKIKLGLSRAVKVTHPFGVPEDAVIKTNSLAFNALDTAVLGVQLLTHGNTKSLESFDGIANLVKIIVEFVLELIVGSGRLELEALSLLFPRADLFLCPEPATSSTNKLFRLVNAVRCGLSETILGFTDIHHRLLALLTLFFVTILDLRLLGRSLRIFVPGNDWAEDGFVELLELIGLILGPKRVALGDIEMTLGVREFLCSRISIGRYS